MKEIWLKATEATKLLGITKVSLHRNRRAGKYVTRKVMGNGGPQYEFLLSSLPPEAQEKYLRQYIPSTPYQDSQQTEAEIEMEIYASAPEWARRKADKYLAILKASDGLRGKELKAFIKEWNKKNPELKTSYPRVVEARKIYREQGVAGLLAKYGKGAGKTKVPDDFYEYFKSLYLKEGAPSQKSCWLYTLGFAKQKNPHLDVSEFPSVTAFVRRLKKEIPEQAIYMARYGYSAWNRKCGSYIDREYSNILAGEVWVSDHAQVDVAVLTPEGKVAFPWVTAWRDFKTGKWLGWFLHIEAPNSDHIFQSFYYSALKYGIPTYIYIDNGKDYRCRDFAGGRTYYHKVTVDEKKTTSMVALLGITPHFSLPYNAQSKPIERDFLTNKLYLSKLIVGYRGGCVVERPEKLKDEIKQGKILKFEEFKMVFDEFIEEVLNNLPSAGKNLRGKSRNQAWAEEFSEKRAVSNDALKLFCMRTGRVVTIGRNGVRDSELGVTYWAEWMTGVKGERVYIRRDIQNYAEAWVFRAENDEYLGKARIAELSAPALAKTEVEKAELKKALAKKKRDKKIAQAYAKTQSDPDPIEKLAHLKAGVGALAGETPEANPKVSRLANTKMDKVIHKDREMEKTGTYDLSGLVPTQRRKPIYLWETDKEYADKN